MLKKTLYKLSDINNKNIQFVLLTVLQYHTFVNHLKETNFEYVKRCGGKRCGQKKICANTNDIIVLASTEEIEIYDKYGLDYLNRRSTYDLYYIISNTYKIPNIENLTRMEQNSLYNITSVYRTDQGLLESNFMKQCVKYLKTLKKTNNHLNEVVFHDCYNYKNFDINTNKFLNKKFKKKTTFYDIKYEKTFNYTLSDQICPGYYSDSKHHEDEMMIGSLATVLTYFKDRYPNSLKLLIFHMIQSFKYIYILEQDKNIFDYVKHTFGNKLDLMWNNFYIHYKLKEIQSNVFQKRTSRHSEFKLPIGLDIVNFFVKNCKKNFMFTVPKNKNLVLITPKKMYKFDKTKNIALDTVKYNKMLIDKFPFIKNLFILNEIFKHGNILNVEPNGIITTELIRKYTDTFYKKTINNINLAYICGSSLYKHMLPGYNEQFKDQFTNSDIDIYVSCGYKQMESYFDLFVGNFLSKDEYTIEKIPVNNKKNSYIKKILITRISTGQKMDLFTTKSAKIDLLITRFHHGLVRNYYDGKIVKTYIGFAETIRSGISLDFYMYTGNSDLFKKILAKYLNRGFGIIIPKKQFDINHLIKVSPGLSFKDI